MLFYFHPGDLGLSEILFILLTFLLMAFAVLAVPVFFIYKLLNPKSDNFETTVEKKLSNPRKDISSEIDHKINTK